MASKKDYLCKDCDNNNNGWCPVRKMNGLKVITDCNDKIINNVKVSVIEDKLVNPEIEVKEIDDKSEKMMYENLGARELFYIIQQQLSAMEDNLTVVDVKKIMVNLEGMIQLKENIYGIGLDYEIDEDIYKSSKRISAYWKDKYGKYENK